MYDTLLAFRYLILIIWSASSQDQSGAKIYLQNLSREYVRQITNIFQKQSRLVVVCEGEGGVVAISDISYIEEQLLP